jgi:uncharacterized membrane protein
LAKFSKRKTPIEETDQGFPKKLLSTFYTFNSMKSTKILSLGLLSLVLFSGMAATTSAFGDKNSEERRASWESMTQEERDAKKAKHETRKAEREERRASRESMTQEERDAKKAKHEMIKENSTKTITNLSNGVQIEVTTDNSEVLESFHTKADQKIEKMAEREPRENVTKTITKTDNGFIVTMTSTDQEIVEKMQNRAEKKGKGGKGRRGGFGRRGQQDTQN